jgi:hypothetical protein
MTRSLRRLAALALLVAGCIALQARGEQPKADGEADRDAALAEQLLPKFKPILDRELELIRNICDLAPEQRPKIKAAGEASLKLSLALGAGKEPHAIEIVGAGKNMALLELIRVNLRRALAEMLTPEQAALYAKRVAERDARYRRAIVLIVVANIDSAVHLTTEQRDKICGTLSAAGGQSWHTWTGIEMLQGNNRPSVSDEYKYVDYLVVTRLILPHLSWDQADVWRGRNKVAAFQSVTFRDNEPNEADDWWNGEPGKPAPKAKASRNAKPSPSP